MALPFVLGLVAGAGIVLAVSKSDKIKDGACNLFKKSKDVANDSLEKGKDAVSDVKQTIDATAECIKEKKAAKAEEEKAIEEKKEE